jgi:hypothetical protein
MKKNFVYGEDRFRPHLCVQCKHFFSEMELFKDWFVHWDKSDTITCPVCGVENCR